MKRASFKERAKQLKPGRWTLLIAIAILLVSALATSRRVPLATAAGTSTFQFSKFTYTVDEDLTYKTITVTRTGDLSTPASVGYITGGVDASQRNDFTFIFGRLFFAAGEGSKTFDHFWLDKMNSFTLPGENARHPEVAFRRVKRAEMVRAFLVSDEYRQRFGQ